MNLKARSEASTSRMTYMTRMTYTTRTSPAPALAARHACNRKSNSNQGSSGLSLIISEIRITPPPQGRGRPQPGHTRIARRPWTNSRGNGEGGSRRHLTPGCGLQKKPGDKMMPRCSWRAKPRCGAGRSESNGFPRVYTPPQLRGCAVC